MYKDRVTIMFSNSDYSGYQCVLLLQVTHRYSRVPRTSCRWLILLFFFVALFYFISRCIQCMMILLFLKFLADVFIDSLYFVIIRLLRYYILYIFYIVFVFTYFYTLYIYLLIYFIYLDVISEGFQVLSFPRMVFTLIQTRSIG